VNNREFLLPAIWDPSTLQCTPPWNSPERRGELAEGNLMDERKLQASKEGSCE
jgi:hypothetical protein